MSTASHHTINIASPGNANSSKQISTKDKNMRGSFVERMSEDHDQHPNSTIGRVVLNWRVSKDAKILKQELNLCITEKNKKIQTKAALMIELELLRKCNKMPKTQRVIDNQYKNYQNANNAEKIEAEDFNAIFQNKKKKFKDRIADLIPEFTENLQEHPSAPKLKINDSSIEFVNHITNEFPKYEESVQGVTLTDLNSKVIILMLLENISQIQRMMDEEEFVMYQLIHIKTREKLDSIGRPKKLSDIKNQIRFQLTAISKTLPEYVLTPKQLLKEDQLRLLLEETKSK